MRLAEFNAPDGAEIVVYFFGKTQGGSVDANLSRWRAQFSNPDGSPVRERVWKDSSTRFAVNVGEFHGTYARGIGAGSPETAKPGQQLMSAIVETPNGTMYIQLFGPDAAVEKQREAFTQFIRGVH